MKETFKEPLENRVELIILFCILIFMWLFSNLPWMSLIVAGIIYTWFGSKYYYLTIHDDYIEIIYPLMRWKDQQLSIHEVENIYHLILYQKKRRTDLIRVNTESKEFKVSIDREPEDFRKINELIHHVNWGPYVRTKGDDNNIKDVIKRREEGWMK